MSNIPTLPASDVRELDRKAIEEYGIPSQILMENAGRGFVDELLKENPTNVVVLCGPGNNGGDGFVIARTLFNRGVKVSLYFVGPLEKIEKCSADVRLNAKLWKDLGQNTEEIDNNEQLLEFETLMSTSKVSHVADALFGTGLERDIRKPYAEVIHYVNKSTARIFAVDIPSGLQATSGKVLGVAIRAHATVTFVSAKTGMFTDEGPKYVGKIYIVEIGIPRGFIEEALRMEK